MSVRFDALFQHSPNAYMVVDRELRFLDANQAYELLTGLSREQLLGRGLFDVFPGATNDDGSSQSAILRRSLQRVFDTGERDTLALIPYAITIDTADGPVTDMRYWSATHTPIVDSDGHVAAVMQHTMDVTEMHRLREELQRARAATGVTQEQLEEGVLSRAAAVQRDNQRLTARHAFLTDLFAQAPGFMAVLRGPDYIFELANEAYERLVSRSDFVGRPLREVLPEVADQGFVQLLDHVRITGEPFVGRGMPAALRDAEGVERTRFVDFVYQPVRDANGQIDAVFVQGADVTDREVALADARNSEARFRTIADLVPQMIWSTLPDGYHDYYNRRWYDFTGMPVGSTDGEAWAGMFHTEDQPRAWARWRHSLETGEPYEVEYRLRDRNGDYQWVLGRALPVRDATGAIVRWMGTCTEIDDIKRTQQMLERSENALRAADRQKDQFLATLAHELRNPLAPIVTAVQLLRMAPEREATVRQATEIIDRQAVHLRNLVEDLIDVSRVTRGLSRLQTREVRLSDSVAGAIEQTQALITRRGHHLQVDDTGPGVTLDADPVRLTQILTNLLNNAAKYTPPGGTITVEVAVENHDAVVRVRDTGVGMDEALLARVFELFAQAEETPERGHGGLGIGLSLARSLAQLHGGDLTAWSAGPGMGSTFELRIPLQPAVALNV
ncbi:sensor histidine kinase [Lysobacter claricitrinus]|uniref:sensor histidine kinase n=1 Tax=Lysobacter claricitrinus TaxID=3367728 RepID=UPI0037DAD153